MLLLVGVGHPITAEDGGHASLATAGTEPGQVQALRLVDGRTRDAPRHGAADLPSVAPGPVMPLPLPLTAEAGPPAPDDDGLRTLEAAVAAAEELLDSVVLAGATGASTLDEFPNGQIPFAAMCGLEGDPEALLRCDAAAALDLLRTEFRHHFGHELEVVSAYRDYRTQVAVKAVRGVLAATPGTSQHGRGVAVDLGGVGGLGQFDSPAYRWLQENAGRYGWFHPRAMEPGGGGPQEPWHWEFSSGIRDGGPAS